LLPLILTASGFLDTHAHDEDVKSTEETDRYLIRQLVSSLWLGLVVTWSFVHERAQLEYSHAKLMEFAAFAQQVFGRSIIRAYEHRLIHLMGQVEYLGSARTAANWRYIQQ